LAKAILFSDGALLDSRELQFLSLNSALERHACAITLEEHVRRLDGLSLSEKLKFLTDAERLDPGLVETVYLETLHRWNCAVRLCVRQDRIKQALMLTLRSFGLCTAVCSSAPQDVLGTTMEALGVHPWVDVALGGDQGIPVTQLHARAAEIMAIPLSDCVVVEDSPLGLAWAVSAGFSQLVHLTGPNHLNIGLLRSYLPAEPQPRAA
jgi:beta-phosphoglucomutase-like phosphatase (HAD superfamily)